MEPRLPMPMPSPEMGGYPRPEAPKKVEATPSQVGGEIQPVNVERGEVLPQGPPPEPTFTPVAPPPLPVVPAPVADDAVVQPVVDDNPIAAADDELIEKEWVDKAKRIVKETRSDPYKQEDEVSKLQADYLKKRYGKDIKLSK